jgi:transposase-like protein
MTKKKLPVVSVAAREEEAARVAGLSVQPRLPLAELEGAIREGLMAFSCATGLVVIAEMMEEERTRVAGPRGKHDPARTAERNGSAPGSVVLGGRKVPVSRPRAVRTDGGGEVTLDTYQVFCSTDLLTREALERMLAGVATRRHALVAEPIGSELEELAKGDSKSAVSRRFKTATEAKLTELLSRDLADLEVAALMIDGIVFAECCCVVALAITADGTKVPVGLWDGDSENTVVVRDLLADLVGRGLRFEQGILCVIDGSKALAAGVKRVFGRHAVVQRCTLHKRRNCADYLPRDLARATDAKLAKAFNDADWQRGRRVARGIAAQLEEHYPSAAASLREGLEDMFTVRRLGVPDRLARTMSCTNAVESMISVVQALAGRVKRWQDTKMVRRWVAAGMLEAERSFRRVKGCKEMPILVAAVRAEVARRVAADTTPDTHDSRCLIWGEMRLCGPPVWAGASGSGRSPEPSVVDDDEVLRGGSGRAERDRETETLQLGDKSASLSAGITARPEVVVAEVLVHLPGGKQVPDQLDEAVGDGDGSLIGSAAPGDLPVLGSEAAALCPDRGACALDQGAPEPLVAGGGADPAALAGRLELPGHTPAQEARSPAVGKRVISAPVSATMTSTLDRSRPGTGRSSS